MKRLLAVLSLILMVLTVGCRSSGGDGTAEPREEVRIISEIRSTDDPTDYTVAWFPSGCEEFERVDVAERVTEVLVTVWVWVDSGGCQESDGESSTSLALTEPLGERSFVDANMGTTVKVDASPGPPEDLDP